MSLDLALAADQRPASRILQVAEGLFTSIKSASIPRRSKFPEVLRTNNFGLSIRLTPTHAFLEVSKKLYAQRSREEERLRAYRQFFTSIDSPGHAAFALSSARLGRFASIRVQGAHAFALGSDISFCGWDLTSIALVDGKESKKDIDIIYVVGFGPQIPRDAAWHEFDTLIRTSISDWSNVL